MYFLKILLFSFKISHLQIYFAFRSTILCIQKHNTLHSEVQYFAELLTKVIITTLEIFVFAF